MVSRVYGELAARAMFGDPIKTKKNDCNCPGSGYGPLRNCQRPGNCALQRQKPEVK